MGKTHLQAMQLLQYAGNGNVSVTKTTLGHIQTRLETHCTTTDFKTVKLGVTIVGNLITYN